MISGNTTSQEKKKKKTTYYYYCYYYITRTGREKKKKKKKRIPTFKGTTLTPTKKPSDRLLEYFVLHYTDYRVYRPRRARVQPSLGRVDRRDLAAHSWPPSSDTFCPSIILTAQRPRDVTVLKTGIPRFLRCLRVFTCICFGHD